MALADLPVLHGVLEDLRRLQGAQRVRHGGPRLSKAFRELLLREVVCLHEQLVRARGLDRVEVGPLQVLDERELEAVADVLADHGRDRGLARDARCEHATVAGDELVATIRRP